VAERLRLSVGAFDNISTPMPAIAAPADAVCNTPPWHGAAPGACMPAGCVANGPSRRGPSTARSNSYRKLAGPASHRNARLACHHPWPASTHSALANGTLYWALSDGNLYAYPATAAPATPHLLPLCHTASPD